MYSYYSLLWSHFNAALKENLRKDSNLQSVCILFLEDFLFSDTLMGYFYRICIMKFTLFSLEIVSGRSFVFH